MTSQAGPLPPVTGVTRWSKSHEATHTRSLQAGTCALCPPLCADSAMLSQPKMGSSSILVPLSHVAAFFQWQPWCRLTVGHRPGVPPSQWLFPEGHGALMPSWPAQPPSAETAGPP